MKNDDFKDLVKSVRQAGKIRRKKMRPSRVFKYKPADIKKIREQLGKSQTEFALMIGVSVATLRNWEQGRRVPDGPARALLMIAAKRPDAVVEALSA
jgi:putative transcriptional regulator